MNKKNFGGAQAGAGGTVSVIHISKNHARRLRALMRHANRPYGREAVGAWVEAEIDRAWEAFDQAMERAAELALLGEQEVDDAQAPS